MLAVDFVVVVVVRCRVCLGQVLAQVQHTAVVVAVAAVDAAVPV